jgi:hypothetical protein
LARRDRNWSLNDVHIQNPSNAFGIVPLSNFVPRGFGFVHHSIAILYHEAPNPYLTIRNFLIAVQHPELPAEATRRPSAVGHMVEGTRAVCGGTTLAAAWLCCGGGLLLLPLLLLPEHHAAAAAEGWTGPPPPPLFGGQLSPAAFALVRPPC